jgi:hypothetical protein
VKGAGDGGLKLKCHSTVMALKSLRCTHVSE